MAEKKKHALMGLLPAYAAMALGGAAFDALARKLAAVPKREVVAAEKRYERRKLKKKKS